MSVSIFKILKNLKSSPKLAESAVCELAQSNTNEYHVLQDEFEKFSLVTDVYNTGKGYAANTFDSRSTLRLPPWTRTARSSVPDQGNHWFLAEIAAAYQNKDKSLGSGSA